MPDEEAFCLLIRLMSTYGLRGHFLPEMPALQMRLFQFDRLLEEVLPVLHVHFLRQGIKSSMFCSQWFLTIFSYRCVNRRPILARYLHSDEMADVVRSQVST